MALFKNLVAKFLKIYQWLWQASVSQFQHAIGLGGPRGPQRDASTHRPPPNSSAPPRPSYSDVSMSLICIIAPFTTSDYFLI